MLEVYADDPYVELIKDVDVFDRSLYKGAEGFYRIHKPDEIFKEYVNRIKKVREELDLPPENVLELVNDAWNFFPHKALGGLSPEEKRLEYQNEKES